MGELWLGPILAPRKQADAPYWEWQQNQLGRDIAARERQKAEVLARTIKEKENHRSSTYRVWGPTREGQIVFIVALIYQRFDFVSSRAKMESKHNRTPMTCPICFNTETVLSTHLRRKCMRFRSDDEIKATLAEARKNLMKVASKGIAINYQQFAKQLCEGRCLGNILGFLSQRGFIIYNKPIAPRNDQTKSQEVQCENRDPLGRDCAPYIEEYKSDQPAEDGEKEEVKQVTLVQVPPPVEEEIIVEAKSEEDDAEEIMETEELPFEPKCDWNNPLRKKMREAGLYKRHSINLEPISGFVKYLSKTLSVIRYKQEVENVARFLYYMDNNSPSLKFVYNIEKANDYFSMLLEIGNTHQTVFNYLKNVKRFIYYSLNTTSLAYKDKETYQAANTFFLQLKVFQKRLSKGISKENIANKEKFWSENIMKPDELDTVLSIAAPDFESALKKAEKGGHLIENEKLTILRYLESLIILQKLQRPGVVQNMTVDEWKKRIVHKETHVRIPVHEHKTAANQLATVILTKEEEKWFEIYYSKVRPTFLKKNTEIQNFFISSTGEKIHSVTNDVARFHSKFGLKPVTSQMVRRITETFVDFRCKDCNDKELFAKYLVHSNTTAERVYREKHMCSMVKGSLVLAKLLQDIQQEPHTSIAAVEEEKNKNIKETNSVPPVKRSKEEEFKVFVDRYPLTVEKDPPPLKTCFAEATVHYQHIYDRWRKQQNKQRVDYIIGLLQDHKPDEEEVKRTIQLQQWRCNLPRVKDILESWRKRDQPAEDGEKKKVERVSLVQVPPPVEEEIIVEARSEEDDPEEIMETE
ncbi:uncharacterized protein ACNLHF_021200 [Anomaloglossus baeobatrachus]